MSKFTNEQQMDRLEVVGIMSKGFGFAPKLIMQDTRLSAEAKAIYCYFASYAGSGDSAFPKVDTILYHLDMGKDRYYRHFKQLTTYGYISVRQVKIDGRYAHNVYTLNQLISSEPIENTQSLPSPQNKETGKESPIPQNKESENKTMGNEPTENEDSNNNSSNSNNFNINSSQNQSFYQSIYKSKSKPKRKGSKSDSIEGRNEEELQQYFYNMEIDKLQEEPETIEALKDVIRHMYYAKEIKVNNSTYPHSVIKSVISKLNNMHLDYALKSFNKATKEVEIKNPLMYMISTIYNSVINIDFGIKAKVNYDLNPDNFDD